MDYTNFDQGSDFEEMTAKLGTRVANCMGRYGANTIEKLKDYVVQHQFSKTEGFICLYWKGIGPETYKQILNFLKEEGAL